ncbi:hypothetical protein [Nitrospira sp. Nam80]
MTPGLPPVVLDRSRFSSVSSCNTGSTAERAAESRNVRRIKQRGRALKFEQDSKDTRGIPLYVYDHSTKKISAEPLEEFLDLLPTRLVQFRIYAHDHEHYAALSRAAATVLNKTASSIEANV